MQLSSAISPYSPLLKAIQFDLAPESCSGDLQNLGGRPLLYPVLCRTFHDITRYIHEKAVEELIHLSEKKGAQHLSAPKKLIADIPLGLMVIDAGGGTSCPPDARVVTPDQVVSLPFHDF